MQVQMLGVAAIRYSFLQQGNTFLLDTSPSIAATALISSNIVSRPSDEMIYVAAEELPPYSETLKCSTNQLLVPDTLSSLYYWKRNL